MRSPAALLLTILVLFVAGPAHGQGLLNKLYARFDAGYTTYGDEVLKEAGAWSTGVSAMANVPVMEYVDVFAHYTFSTFFGDPPEKPFHRELSNFAFDEISHAIGVGVVGHVAPEDQIDLFLSASVTGVDQSTGDESINPVTIRISLGSELRSDSPLSVRPYVSYLSIDTNFQGNDNQRLDDGELGFDASYWLYSHLFLGFSAGVTFDDKNVEVTAGAGISL